MDGITLKDSAFSDGRVNSLIRIIGQEKTYGCYVVILSLAKNYWKRGRQLIPKEVYELNKFPEEFITVGLVERHTTGYYVKGSRDYIHQETKSTKIKLEPTKANIEMDFLSDEIKNFISGVSDIMRKRWLECYDEETIKTKLEDAYEWSLSKGKTHKNVGLLMNKFFENVPKNNLISDEIASELDRILGEE